MSLKARLARGPVTVVDTCDILDGVARALDAAHSKDIVHRDLKPDNVYLHQVDGGPRMVKLLDFGIAKLMRAQMKMEKTQTGNMLGTPRYISPEQARGVDVDHRSDIYSLGVIAYEMLAGRPPFQGETAMDLVVKHLSDPAPPLSQFARVPKLLEQCVMRMLEKDPKARPSLEVVRQILTEPTKRSAALAKGFAGRPSRAPYVVGGVLVLAASLGFVAWKVSRERAADPVTPTPVAVKAPEPAPVVAPPVVEARGTLNVTVTGAKTAVILVDGKELGRGEAVRAELAPGTHEVEVRAPGREPIVQHVEIAAGAANTVAVVVADPPRTPPRTNRVTRSPPSNTPKPPDDDELLTPKRGTR